MKLVHIALSDLVHYETCVLCHLLVTVWLYCAVWFLAELCSDCVVAQKSVSCH